MADLYYIEEGYYDAGYFVYTADAAAAVSSTSSLSAVVGKNQSIDLVSFSFATLSVTLNTIKEGASAVSSSSSITANAGKIIDVNDAYPYTWDSLTSWENFVSNNWRPSGIIVVSAFSLTGTLVRLPIQGFVSCDSQSSLSVSADRLAGFAGDLTSIVSQSISVGKITTGVSDLSLVVSQETIISKTAGASSEMSSSFTQTATISHIEGADLFAFTEAAISVQVDRIRDNNIAATAVFNVATDATRIQQGDSDSDAVFTAIINGLRSRDVNLETQAAFSFAVAVDKIKSGSAALESISIFGLTLGTLVPASADIAATTTQSTIGYVTRTTSSNLNTNASIDISINRIQSASISLSSQADLSATISHIEGADLSAFSDAALSAQVERTRDTQAQLNSNFDLQPTATRIKQLQLDISSEANLSSLVNASRQVSVSIQSAVELSATISHIEGADLSAFSNAALSAQAERTRDNQSQINSSVSLESTAERIQQAQIDLVSQSNVSLTLINVSKEFSVFVNSTFEVNATISHIHGADIEAENFASISAQAQATLNGVVAIDAQVDTVIDGDAVRDAVITATSAFTTSVNANIFKDIQSNQQAEFSKVINANKAVSISQNLTSGFAVYCQITNYRGIDMFAFSNNALTIQAEVIAGAVSNITASAEISIAGLLTRDADSQCEFSFAQSLTANRLRDVNSQCEFNFAQSLDANRVRNGDSSQTVSSTLAADSIIVKDAHLTSFGVVSMTTSANVIWASNYSQQTATSSIGILAGKINTASATISAVSILKGAVDRGIVMRPLFGLTSTQTAGSGTGRAGDSIVNNALYITKSQGGSAGIISTLPQTNVFTILDAYNGFSYSGQYDVSIRFKIRVQNATGLDKFIYAGNVSSGNYWAISYGTGATRAFTFTSYDTGRGVNHTHNYTSPTQSTSIYNTWLDIEFYSASANRSGLSGTQNYCYFVINGVSSGRLTSTFISNGGVTEQFFGTNLPSASLVIRNPTIDNLVEIDDVQINIKQNQNYGSATDNQFRKIYLPFTGNYYDWNSAVQQNAQSAITSQASLQGTISGPQKATANISSATSLSAIIGKLQDINLVAFDDAELTAAAGRIQQGAIAIQSNSSITCDAAKKIDNSISSTSSFSQSANLDRLRNASIATESIFSELVVGEQNIGVIAHLTNRFNTARPYVDDGYVGEGYAEVYDTTAVKTASGVANLNVNATLTASATTVADFASLVMSAGTMTVNAVKTTDALASSSIVGSLSTAAIKTAVSQQALSAVFTASIKADKSGDIALYAFTNATLDIQPTWYRNTSADLDATATFYFDSSGALFQQGNAAVVANTAVNVSGNRIRFGAITTEAIASELVAVVKTTATDVDMVVNSTLTVEASKFKIISVAISVSTSQSTTAIKTARGTSAITSAMTFAVSYRDLRIDEIEYRIPAEGWAYSINGETRLHLIVGETRLRKITEETAIKPIASETRIHIID